MTQDSALEPLRQGGARAITIFLWLNQAMIMPVGLAIGSDRCWSAFVLGLAVLIAPSWCWHKRRIDASARLTFGIALVVYPMLFVYLFEGHPWQMDLHMHFFVCFSLMALLFDARPILLGAALTVLHHLLLYLVMPDWVFPGSGSVPRVLLHGFLVSCLVGTLLTTIRLIARLTMTNVSARAEADEARAGAEQALREADVARSRAEAALAQSREAEARAEHEHRERLAAEAALSDVSSERRAATANRIEEGIGVLVDDLLLVADKIAQQAKDIASVSSALVEQANGLGTSSASAVVSIETVAASSEELTASIRQVSSNAESAQRVATATAQSISTLEPGIAKLTHEVDAARDILAMVSQIATQSNLLALNATIEAARSGEAGRGFGVVANEMKQMASATGRAADEIAMKLAGIVGAASVFKELIATSSAHADEIKASSLAIFAAVEQQQQATIAIGEGAERVLAKAVDTDRRSQTLTDVAGRNGSIAQDASVLARQLSERAEQLRGRMQALLGDLRAA